MKEFIDNAKANPGKVTFATPGIGTTPHLTAELFKKTAGVDLTHVPYRGVAAGAMNDLITNRIDCMFNTTGSLLQAVRSGQVRGLAQSTPRRSPLAPEFPTFAEAGVPGFNVSSWYGLFAPARTPREIVAKMHDSVATMLKEPAIKSRYEVLGVEAASATPDQLTAHYARRNRAVGPDHQGGEHQGRMRYSFSTSFRGRPISASTRVFDALWARTRNP